MAKGFARSEKYFRPHPPHPLSAPFRLFSIGAPPARQHKRRTKMQESYDRRDKNRVLGVTSLASFMMALDSLVITTAFATIRADFGASVEKLQWAVNAFNLTFAVLLLTGAALGDRFGRRRMFAVGIALFVLASAACALAGTAETLIASRAAQGAGAALVMPLAMAILSGAFAKEERARALGIFSGVTGCALIIGPAIGVTLGFGPLSAGLRLLPWTSTLFLTAPIAGVVVQKFGERPLVVSGLLMQAVGLGWIAMEAAPGVAYPALVVPLVLAGVGVSMAMPAAQNAVLSSVAVTEMGKASGVFNMGRFLGGMFGIALLVAVFSANGAVDSPAHFSTGFAAAMVVAAALSLAGACVGLWLPARRAATAAPMPDNDRLSLSID
jgi:MFS family permease